MMRTRQNGVHCGQRQYRIQRPSRTPESPNNVGGPINKQITIGSSPAAGLRIRYNDGIFLAGNMLRYPEQRRMTALDLEGSRGAVVANQFTVAKGVGDDTAGMTGQANSTASDAKPSKTEWKRIPGGFAVKVTLEDGVVVALMRGGPRLKTPPEKIEGYGYSTEKEFA